MPPNPQYSPDLQYAPTFRFGGRAWGQGDLAAFIKRIGGPKKYSKWARQHAVAAKSFDPTEAEVYSQIQPVLTGYDAERVKRQAYYDHLMKNLGGFTAALQGQLGAIAPAIGSAYREGAETMGAAGTGYGTILNNTTAEAAAGANQVLSQIGAPEGQMISGGDAGGVLAGLAGWIPQAMMNTQGGAYAAAASHLPAQAGVEAQYTMKGIVDKATQEEADRQTSIRELLQTIPGIRSKAKTAQQSAALLKQKFNLQQLEAERSWYMDQAKLALSLGRAGISQHYSDIADQRAQQSAWESQGRDVNGNPKPGYHEEGGKIVKDGWKMGKQGVPVKVGGATGGKSGSTSSTVPGTPAYKAKALQAVGKQRPNVDKAITVMARKPTIDEIRAGASPTKLIKPTYEAAYAQLLSSYGYLGINPATKAALAKMIRDALKAAGYTPGVKHKTYKGMGPPAPAGTPKVP